MKKLRYINRSRKACRFKNKKSKYKVLQNNYKILQKNHRLLLKHSKNITNNETLKTLQKSSKNIVDTKTLQKQYIDSAFSILIVILVYLLLPK